MASEISYLCQCCGERHDGPPMSYGTDAPAYWDPSFADDGSSMLEQEQCIIKAGHFFIRGRLVIPVTDAPPGTEFDWGVWVSLSRDNFSRALSLWTAAGREQEPPSPNPARQGYRSHDHGLLPVNNAVNNPRS